jgi:phospholipase/lecithinase/hemolysin
MMLLLSLLAVTGAAYATAPVYGTEIDTNRPTKVENVVAFGDSYTDEYGLYSYFAYDGATPPPATNTTGNNVTSTVGWAWGHVATQLLGAQYYDYAGKKPKFLE